jgi:plasmid stabilization system protein ParE
MGGSEKDSQAEEKKTYHILIKPRARQNLQEAYDWYEDREDGLGERFKDAFDDGCSRVQSDPFRPALIYRDVRRLLFKKFPYHIYYRVTGETIKILTVVHASRAERHWKRHVRENQ